MISIKPIIMDLIVIPEALCCDQSPIYITLLVKKRVDGIQTVGRIEKANRITLEERVLSLCLISYEYSF